MGKKTMSAWVWPTDLKCTPTGLDVLVWHANILTEFHFACPFCTLYSPHTGVGTAYVCTLASLLAACLIVDDPGCGTRDAGVDVKGLASVGAGMRGKLNLICFLHLFYLMTFKTYTYVKKL